MGKFILGIIFTLAVIAVCVYVYFSTGMAPVATNSQAMPFEKKLANMALHARVEKEMPKNVPVQWDPNNLTEGVHVYKEDCAVCHGLPNQPETAIAKGMFPKPPQLFHGHGVTDDPPQETYWKVANGIRLTGMPAFKGALSDTELWQVSLLLANADKLPPAATAALGSTPPAANPPPAGANQPPK